MQKTKKNVEKDHHLQRYIGLHGREHVLGNVPDHQFLDPLGQCLKSLDSFVKDGSILLFSHLVYVLILGCLIVRVQRVRDLLCAIQDLLVKLQEELGPRQKDDTDDEYKARSESTPFLINMSQKKNATYHILAPVFQCRTKVFNTGQPMTQVAEPINPC